MKLHPIATENLQYLEASQLITRLFDDIEFINLNLKKDNEMDQRFETLRVQSEEFYKSLLQIRGMAESKQLEELDLERDQKMTTIRLHVAAFRYRREKEIKDAYLTVQIVLDRYKDVETLNYEAESKAIQKFLDEWSKAEYGIHVNVLNLLPQLDSLRTAAAAFDNLFHNRSVITMFKENYDARMLKGKMIKTYTSLAKYIMSMVEFEKDNDLYPHLLDAFNNGRKYFSDILAKRNGGKGDEPDAGEGKK